MTKDLKKIKAQCKRIEKIFDDCDKRLDRIGTKLIRMQVETEIQIKELEWLKLDFEKINFSQDELTDSEKESIRLYDKMSDGRYD